MLILKGRVWEIIESARRIEKVTTTTMMKKKGANNPRRRATDAVLLAASACFRCLSSATDLEGR